MRVRSRFAAVVAAVCLCVTVGAIALTTPAGSTPRADAPGTFTAGGSINQVYTYGHAPGTAVQLLDASDAVLHEGVADAQGALLFKDVPKGTGYRVRAAATDGTTTSGPLTVTDPGDVPPQSFYANTHLSAGFGYLPTRDGTLLSVNVTMPTDGSTGPWPVVMDYSGYDPSQPGGAPQEAAFYPFRGYVTVGVNMRGTTCSGGAFDFFEPPQSTDGYDAVETLAAQSWSNGNVGLVGISYSGYSQLYVGATQPPHLRAITPLSPYADTYRSILYPGGILNNGFARNWAADRQEAAKPRAHQWVRDRIANGDTVCAANQVMRLQSRDLLAEITPGRFDERPLGDYLDTTTFASKITVPVYLAAQFQDEQTGGHSAELATIFEKNPKSKAVFTNGAHIEPLGITELPRVLEFVDFYVGQKIPALGPVLRAALPTVLGGLFGNPLDPPPPDRFAAYTSYDAALAAYEAEPPVRIRYQNGGRPGKEGAPYSVYDAGYSAWPIPTATAERWYLQPDGSLATTAPTVADDEARGASTYTYDPTSKRRQSFDGGTDAMWQRHPDVHWDPLKEGNSLSFTTPAFTKKTGYAGTGSVDLWVQSSAADTDFEVTLTEVRADGHEQQIQSGWLRASHRKLDPAKSTELRPYQTHTAGDAAALPAGQFVPVRIELFPFAQVVPAGSRLRLNVEAPGGNQAFWAFDDLPGPATNQIAHSAGRPSSVVLPRLPYDLAMDYYTSGGTPNPCVVAGVTTQSQSFRNQPCRAYHPARVPTAVAATRTGSTIDVSWTAPARWADGTDGVPTGYLVTAAPGGATVHVGGGVTTAAFTTGSPGTRYSFTVQAEYGATAAPASDASGSVLLPVAGDDERFLRAVFPSLLGRPIDPASLRFWLIGMGNGASRTKVSQYIVGSDEYRRRVVATEYQAILGRVPTGTELTAAAAALRADPRVDALRAQLLGSAEFYQRAGSTSAGFTTALFQAELGRAPDPLGFRYVDYRLAAGDTRAKIAAWLVRTNEADGHLVAGWFQQYLGRAPTAGESSLLIALLHKGRTEGGLIATLTGSDEYLAKAP